MTAPPAASERAACARSQVAGSDQGAPLTAHASAPARDAAASGRTLREVAREHGVDEATLDEALDLRKIAAGSQA